MVERFSIYEITTESSSVRVGRRTAGRWTLSGCNEGAFVL